MSWTTGWAEPITLLVDFRVVSASLPIAATLSDAWRRARIIGPASPLTVRMVLSSSTRVVLSDAIACVVAGPPSRDPAEWTAARDAIREAIETQGWSEERLAGLVTRDSMIGAGLPLRPEGAP